MGDLEFLDIHDCRKPSMVTGQLVKFVERRKWWGRPYIEEVRTTTYETRDAKWTCPECGATWRWLTNGSYIAFWICDYRPEKWVKSDN